MHPYTDEFDIALLYYLSPRKLVLHVYHNEIYTYTSLIWPFWFPRKIGVICKVILSIITETNFTRKKGEHIILVMPVKVVKWSLLHSVPNNGF